jgi:hypothetical protein
MFYFCNPIKCLTMRRNWVVAVVFCLGLETFAQVARPLKFNEETFDFGTVVEENGPVTHEFVFTNASTKPLQILLVKPSCGCTTPGWTKEPIMPGKTGSIKAQFDPKGRPGYFNKSLTVTTDYDNQPVILQIKGTVTQKSKDPKSDFKVPSGNFFLKSLSFNFGKVYRKDEFVVREYELYNAGTKTITYSGKFDGPLHIKVSVEPASIEAGKLGVLKVSYNGKLKDRYGFQSDNIVLHTDDEQLPLKSFNVYATLEDHFPELKPEDLAKAPRLRIISQSVDFGSMKQNQASTREVQLTNGGKSGLEIRSVVPNCTCITAVAAKSNLKEGESTTLTIAFNPQDRKGTQTKSITVYTNDPQMPVQRITLTGVVE